MASAWLALATGASHETNEGRSVVRSAVGVQPDFRQTDSQSMMEMLTEILEAESRNLLVKAICVDGKKIV